MSKQPPKPSKAVAAAYARELLKKHLDVIISEEQSLVLWDEIEVSLIAVGDKQTARYLMEGSRDTYDREGLLDRMGHVLGGKEWPCFGTPEEESNAFYRAIYAGARSRFGDTAIPAEILVRLKRLAEENKDLDKEYGPAILAPERG